MGTLHRNHGMLALAGLLGLAAMLAPTPREEARRARSVAADHVARELAAPSRAPAAPHPSDIVRWADEGHPVSDESLREASAHELERITLARSWVDRLDEEARAPSCPRCEPALDGAARASTRIALQRYEQTLAAIAGGDLAGQGALEGYRAARETLLEELSLEGLGWLGRGGFLDGRVDVAALVPALHASHRELRPAGDTPATGI